MSLTKGIYGLVNVTQLGRGTRVKIRCLGAISHCLRNLSPEQGVKGSVKSQSAGIRGADLLMSETLGCMLERRGLLEALTIKHMERLQSLQ